MMQAEVNPAKSIWVIYINATWHSFDNMRYISDHILLVKLKTVHTGYNAIGYTGRMGWMAHRKWKEAKQLPGRAGPGNMLGCSLIFFHFLWAIHPIRPV